MTEREIVEVMARAICSEVGPCTWADCKGIGTTCHEQRSAEARHALAALEAAGYVIVPRSPLPRRTPMAKEPGQLAFYAAGWVTPWDHLDDQTRAQWAAIEAAIRASALEEAAAKAESFPGAGAMHIANAIRSLILRPADGGTNG